jgi:membrane protein YdbS with pleckstrin-like domain
VPEPGPTPSLTDSRRARKDVEKYLLEDEAAVIATRRHWASLALPGLLSLPILVIGGWLFLLDPANHVTSATGLLVVLAGLGYLALRVAEWWMRHFIVSPRRMLLTSGVFVRTVTLLPRRRITDLTWQGTFFGQILGYGTFRIESAGQHQALSRVTFLPRPEELYRTISRLLFPDDGVGGSDEGDEEPPPRRPPGPPPTPQPPRTGPPTGPPTMPSGRADTEPIPGVRPAQP